MSVVAVTLKWSGSAITNENGRSEITRVYDVLHDTPVDADIESVGTQAVALGLPAVGAQFPGKTFMTVESQSLVRMIGPILGEVAIQYASEAPVEGDPTTNPGSIEVAWGFSPVIEPVTQDLDGKLIGTILDEPFDPPMNVEKFDVTLSISRNEWLYDPAMVVAFNNSINTDNLPTFGVLAGQARLRVQPVGLVNEVLVRMRYDLTFRQGVPSDLSGGGPAKAWYRRVAHVGFRGIPLFSPGDPPPGPEPVELKDANGNRRATPVKLDLDGNELPSAAPYFFREFRHNPLKAFGLLKLQQTYLASKWGRITGPVGL